MLILLTVAPALAAEDSWSAFTNHVATGWQQTLEGLKVVFWLFVGLVVLAFAAGGKSGKRPRKKSKPGGPIGGSHAVEAMILDKDYENPFARKGARYIRDKLLG